MMKKGLFTAVILSCSSLFGMMSGNPAESALFTEGAFFSSNHCFSVRAGYYGNYTFNRYMRVDEPTNDSIIDQTEVYSSGGTVTLNLFNRIDLYGILVGTTAHIETPSRAFGVQSNLLLKIDAPATFTWGVGGKYSHPFLYGSFIGIGGSYLQGPLPLTYIQGENLNPTYLLNLDFNYTEWQASLGCARPFECCSTPLSLIPYLNIKFSRAYIDMGEASVFVPTRATLFDLISERVTGLSVGLSLLYFSMAEITVEGSFFDELGVCVSGQLRF